MPTSFKQVANNAQSTAASGAFNNTTSPLTFSVQTGHGARFPSPGNGFYLTIWNSASYPDPFSDPNMEIVLCTARTTDSLTVTRAQRGTTATAKTGSPDVRLLVDSTHISDLNTAVVNLENQVGTLKVDSGSVSSASSNQSITFNKTFTSAPAVTVALSSATVNVGGGDRGVVCAVDSVTTTGATIHSRRTDDGSLSIRSGTTLYWHAIGT